MLKYRDIFWLLKEVKFLLTADAQHEAYNLLSNMLKDIQLK